MKDINEIMKAVRRMRDYQKRARSRINDYDFQSSRRDAEKEVDRLITEWEQEEFHKVQKQLF